MASLSHCADEYIPLRDIPRQLPGNVSIQSVYRWIERGVRGVRLPSVLVGGRRYVLRSALGEFVAATTAAAEKQTQHPRTPRQRERAIAAAEQQLAKDGV